MAIVDCTPTGPSLGLEKFDEDGLLKEDGYALVLGSGMGDSIFLAERGYFVDAVGEKMAREEAKRGGLPISFYFGDISGFDVPPGTYDVIVANNALRSIEDKQTVARVIQKMAEGLVPGGLLYVSLFGLDDGWFGRNGMSFFAWDEAVRIVSGLFLKTHYSAIEEEHNPSPLSGDIHHQIFHFLCVKE